MLYSLIIFFLGISIGQEYNDTLPSVKNLTLEMYNTFTTSNFYKKIKDDFSKR